MKSLRIIVASTLLLVSPAVVQAQSIQPIPGAYPTTTPSGYTSQPFDYDCGTACWPVVEIWNGSKKVNVTVAGALQVDASASPQPITQAAGSVAAGAYVSGSIADIFSSSPPAAYTGTGAATLITEAEAIRTNSAAGVTNATAGGGPAKAVATAGIYLSSPPTLTSGQSEAVLLDSKGAQVVNVATSVPVASTAALGSYVTGSIADLYSATPPAAYAGSGTANTITELEAIRRSVGSVGSSNTTCNGFAPSTLTTAPQCKGTGGTLYDIQTGNSGSVGVFLKIYDAGAAPTCGATAGTPIGDYPIPANASSLNLAGNNITFPAGKSFANGLYWCVTQNAAYNDATAPATGVVNVNMDFQ